MNRLIKVFANIIASMVLFVLSFAYVATSHHEAKTYWEVVASIGSVMLTLTSIMWFLVSATFLSED